MGRFLPKWLGLKSTLFLRTASLEKKTCMITWSDNCANQLEVNQTFSCTLKEKNMYDHLVRQLCKPTRSESKVFLYTKRNHLNQPLRLLARRHQDQELLSLRILHLACHPQHHRLQLGKLSS